MSSPTPFKRGLLIGKFMPPHRGHELMIEFGASMSEEMIVFVSGKSTDKIPVSARARWLEQYYIGTNVRVEHEVSTIPDCTVDENGTAIEEWYWKAWIDRLNELFPGVDAVFTNDMYGERLARELGAKWFPIDPKREAISLSATMVRNDPPKFWQYINREARHDLMRRVAIVGAESVGKSTLVSNLVAHYRTNGVPEYGRTISELRNNKLNESDFRAIVRGHRTMVELADTPVLIVDTDTITTHLFTDLYVPDASDELKKELMCFAAGDDFMYDLTIVLKPTVPWVNDGWRIIPDQKDREEFTNRLVEFYESRAGLRKFVVIDSDDYEERLQEAIKAIDNILPIDYSRGRE